MTTRGSRIRARGVSTGVVLAIVALAVPSLVAAANVTVNAIPGGGWIQGAGQHRWSHCRDRDEPGRRPGHEQRQVDHHRGTPTSSASVAASLGPLSDLTARCVDDIRHRLHGTAIAEPASLRFGMYRLAGSTEFTTMSVERREQRDGDGRDLADMDTVGHHDGLADQLPTGPFCTIAAPCTFAAFKTQYPNATLLGLQVAIGTGIPADDVVHRWRVVDRMRRA